MPYRYICDVLEEMRKMHKTRNFSGFLGSVEEAQGMASRMEAKLHEYKSGKITDERSSKADEELIKKRAELSTLNKDFENKRKDLKRLEDEIKAVRHLWLKETKGGTLIPLPTIEDGWKVSMESKSDSKIPGHCCNASMDGHYNECKCFDGPKVCCDQNADNMKCDCPKAQ